ncbi:MAG TPA: sensor histidine kinase [Bacilli bacterium]
MTLRGKFMIAIIMLVFAPVIALGVISYLTFSETIEKKTSDFYKVSLQETDRKLNYALNQINSVTDVGIVQPVVQKMLKRDISAISDSEEQELNNLFLSHPRIISLSLYSKTRLLYTTNPALTSSFSVIVKQPWYKEMKNLNGKPLWLGPYENDALAEPRYLTFARTVKDYYSLEDIGMLVLTVKPDILEQVFWEASILKQGDILLVNKNGDIIFSKSGRYFGGKDRLPLHFGQNAKNSYIETYQGEKSFITVVPSFNENWYLVAETSFRALRSESAKIRNITLALLAFSLLTALAFDLLFISKLVKAISRVVKGMKRVEQGIFNPVIPVKSDIKLGKDESTMLVDGFNRMSGQIKELISTVEQEQQRKKEAEMQALVAQINPHFIYNSLESINSLAIIHGNKEISKMVVSLGRLLRISISDSPELIPLSMEMEHVKHYLAIQKFRFEDKFEYEIDLPEELGNVLTQKLFVQPIVENALYHGIEPMHGVGKLLIRARRYHANIVIDVIDNGLGFDNETLRSLSENSLTGAKKYYHKGVGLKNVHERIRIRFGSPYGIMICSSPHDGTTVRIRLPLIESPIDDVGQAPTTPREE